MFQIGWWEVVVVIIVALLAFGPEQLPTVLRVGEKWIVRFKRSYAAIQSTIQQLLHEDKP